ALWDVRSRKRMATAAIGASFLAFGLGKRWLVTGEGHQMVRLWGGADLRRICEIDLDHAALARLAVSPDGKTVAMLGPKGRVRLLELATGQERFAFTVNGVDDWPCMAFAPRGQALAVCGGQTIYLCGTATGKVLRRLPTTSTQFDVRFGADGGRL